MKTPDNNEEKRSAIIGHSPQPCGESTGKICDESDCICDSEDDEEFVEVNLTMNETIVHPKVKKLNAALEEKELLTPLTDSEKMSQFLEIMKDKGFNEAVKFMNKHVKAEEQVIEVSYTLNCFANEGAYALFKAVQTITGNYNLSTTNEASGPNPPEIIDIDLPNGKSTKVPWGRVALPTFDDDSFLDMEYYDGDVELIVTGSIKMKFEPEVKAIIEEAKRILETRSIYKGQAIAINFDGDYPLEPKFIDLSNIDENKILISKIAHDGLTPIMARIKNTEQCIKQGLDLKYGAIMEGPYGTGKTLMAFMIAKIAISHGWTFIYLKDCRHLAKTLKIAENYVKTKKGCIVFSEDIDQTMRGNRDAHMQEILNTIDGGDTKQKPIISIFTTNHIELIDPTFMRGKRIGGLISLGALDEDTSIEFIEKFVVNDNDVCLMTDKDEIIQAAKALVGIVPAFASEIIDKAKAFMINRGGNIIKAIDIENAANSYKHQMERAQLKNKPTEDGNMVKAVNYLINAAFKGELDGGFDVNDKPIPIISNVFGDKC